MLGLGWEVLQPLSCRNVASGRLRTGRSSPGNVSVRLERVGQQPWDSAGHERVHRPVLSAATFSGWWEEFPCAGCGEQRRGSPSFIIASSLDTLLGKKKSVSQLGAVIADGVSTYTSN